MTYLLTSWFDLRIFRFCVYWIKTRRFSQTLKWFVKCSCKLLAGKRVPWPTSYSPITKHKYILKRQTFQGRECREVLPKCCWDIPSPTVIRTKGLFLCLRVSPVCKLDLILIPFLCPVTHGGGGCETKRDFYWTPVVLCFTYLTRLFPLPNLKGKLVLLHHTLDPNLLFLNLFPSYTLSRVVRPLTALGLFPHLRSSTHSGPQNVRDSRHRFTITHSCFSFSLSSPHASDGSRRCLGPWPIKTYK